MKPRDQDSKVSKKTTRIPRWFLLGPVAAAFALTLAVLSQPDAPENSATDIPTENLSSRGESRHPQASHVELAYDWKPGELLTYKVRSYTAIRIEEKGWETSGPGKTIEITGLCSYRILKVEGDRVTVGAQMSEARVYGDEQHQAVLEELLNAAPVVLLFDTRGRRLDCLLPPELPTGDREILAGMHEHQLILPEDPGAATWTTAETGRVGAFQCTHAVNRQGAIEKRRAASLDGRLAGCEVLQSNIVATIGGTWLKVLDVRESFAISNGEERIGAAETHFTMSLSARTVEPEGLARLAADSELVASLTSRTTPGGEGDSALERQGFQTLEERYATVPMSKMFDDLRSVTETAEAHEATIGAIHALRDWLLVHPEGAFALVDSLADASLPVGFTARAVHALELASKNPQAQQALADILQRPTEFSRSTVMQAVIASGGITAELRPELHTALSDTINRAVSSGEFTVGDAALYALGKLAQSNPQVAEQLTGALLPDLDASNHIRTTQTALNALANGHLATPEIVAEASSLARSHPAPEVRAAAVHYLSRLPETGPATLVPFLRDPSERVQLEAIDSLALLQPEHPGVNAPLEQHLASSTSDLITKRLNEILKN